MHELAVCVHTVNAQVIYQCISVHINSGHHPQNNWKLAYFLKDSYKNKDFKVTA